MVVFGSGRRGASAHDTLAGRFAKNGALVFMEQPPRSTTGIEGLDIILRGGLPRGCVYLVEGMPGAGKTTLSLQFLLEGVRLGESSLYITLSESRREIEGAARTHGLALDKVSIFEFVPSEELFAESEQVTVFHASDLELNRLTSQLLAEIERVKPSRVVFDSLSEMRLLSQSPSRYRRQILALKQALVTRGCTVMLLDDSSRDKADLQMHSIVHGVISLTKTSPRYGGARRQLEVAKLRGVNFVSGLHDFLIETGGLCVFPRLVAAEHRASYEKEAVSSGLTSLDMLLGGGLQRGTSALLLGPVGSGKSVIGSLYAAAAAARGEHAVIFTFDESSDALFTRSEGLGIDLKRHVDAGRIIVKQIDPAELSPGEFAHLVRGSVEQDGTRVIVIDSLAGYLASMPEASLLTVQMHELLSFLNHHGFLTLLILTQHGLLGNALETPTDISYLADSVILMRYFEAAGEIKKAISVIKKRTGPHETTIREFRLAPKSIAIGAPLSNFQGVLNGVPVFVGLSTELIGGKRD